MKNYQNTILTYKNLYNIFLLAGVFHLMLRIFWNFVFKLSILLKDFPQSAHLYLSIFSGSFSWTFWCLLKLFLLLKVLEHSLHFIIVLLFDFFSLKFIIFLVQDRMCLFNWWFLWKYLLQKSQWKLFSLMWNFAVDVQFLNESLIFY